MLQKFYKNVFSFLILVSPCTGILALGPWLRLPVITLLVLILLFPLISLKHFKEYKVHIDRLFWIICLFLTVSFLSLLLNYIGNKNITNWLPYPWLFLGNYLFIRFLIRNQVSGISIKSVLSISNKAYFLIGGFIILDFLLVNITGIQIRTALVNLDSGTANMYYFIRSNFINTGGVAEEPGIMSMMMNIFFCLALYFSRNKKNTSIIFLYVFHAVVLISLGSTMGIFSFLISQILINWSWKVNVLVIGFAALLFIGLRSALLQNSFFQEMMGKLMLSEDLQSSYTRATLWNTAYYTFLSNPWLGAGPGYSKFLAPDGFMSLALILLAELGLFCFGFLVWFIVESYRKASSIAKVNKSNALKMGIVCSSLHIAVINEYYHLPYWFLLAVVYCIHFSLSKSSLNIQNDRSVLATEMVPL